MHVNITTYIGRRRLKMTNRDKINQMSDEELADVVVFGCEYCPYRYPGCSDIHCKTAFLEWLKSEV